MRRSEYNEGEQKERRYRLVGDQNGVCTQMTEIVARKPTGAARPSTGYP